MATPIEPRFNTPNGYEYDIEVAQGTDTPMTTDTNNDITTPIIIVGLVFALWIGIELWLIAYHPQYAFQG
jgi:hypothetical protein